jgi:hypothetical protein
VCNRPSTNAAAASPSQNHIPFEPLHGSTPRDDDDNAHPARRNEDEDKEDKEDKEASSHRAVRQSIKRVVYLPLPLDVIRASLD